MCGVTSIIIIYRMITIVLTERRGDCMGDYMTLDRLVAMVDAFIRCDSLCEGCEIDDDHGMPCRECREQAADRIEEILKRFPSTDEVEVVRCKDCKYAEPYDDSTYPIHCSYDFPMTEQGTWVKPNDFCSNGERKNK